MSTSAPPRTITGVSIAAGVQAKRSSVIAAICNSIDALPERPDQHDIDAVLATVRDEINRWADNICGSLARLPEQHVAPEVLEARLTEILEAIQRT